MSSIRLQIKDSIMHYLCDDWNNHKRGRAHKENIGLYDREDSKPIWCDIDLEMIMEKVVKGIYAIDFETYEKQIRADAIDKYMNNAHSRILFELVDIMADLNEAEILSHDNINEWLCIWKREVTDVIFRAMREVKKVQTNCDNCEDISN